MKRVPYGWPALRQVCALKPRPLGLVARLLHFGVIQSGGLIDDLFYREWKQSEFSGPLFILGHQRSGTTVVHRALCTDQRAAGSTLLQMALPSLSLWHAIDALERADRFLGGHLGRRFGAAATRKFSALADIHETGLKEVEEDEFYFWSLYASAMCLNGDPDLMKATAGSLLRHPENWDESRRTRLWEWYGDCLKKLACYKGHHPDTADPVWVVAKNPAFSSRIPELLAHFPDARFIIMHRDPRKAIASRLNLIERIWQARGIRGSFGTDNVDEIYRDSIRIYSGLEEQTHLIPERCRVELSSLELARNPRAALDRIQSAFGLEIGSIPEPLGNRPGKTLESYGLTDAQVERDLERVFTRRAWEIR